MNKTKMKILLIGSKGLFGTSFRGVCLDLFCIEEINKYNYSNKLKMIKNNNISFDSVIIASQSSDYKLDYMSEDLFQVNLVVLHSILEAVKNKTNQIIYFSSGSVYSFECDEITEESKLNYDSKNPYIVSKITGEMILGTYVKFFQSIIILRPFFMYGPNQNEKMLFSQLKQKILNNEKIIINKNGGMKFNPIYIDDVSVMVKNIISKFKTGFRVINVAGQESVFLRDVLIVIAKACNKKLNYDENDYECNNIICKSKYNLIEKFTSISEGVKAIV